MKISEILRKDFEVRGDPETIAGEPVYDSRQVVAGGIFTALKGENLDGRDFIEAAMEKGAAAIVYGKDTEGIEKLRDKYPEAVLIGVKDERDAMAYISDAYYGRPSEALTMVGITGTNGKTTTSYIIRAILERWGRNTGLIGTITYLIKDASFDALHTTPEAPDLQKLIREMADAGCSHVVMEVSSHALAQKRVDYTRFKVAVFTNLTRDHLDFHGSMEEYYITKERLFTELLSAGGSAVINTDDPYGKRLAEGLAASAKDINVLTFSVNDPHSDIRAMDIRTDFDGISFRIHACGHGYDELAGLEIRSPLIGGVNVYNTLSALCSAFAMNIPSNIIKEGIEMAALVKGRFEKVDVGQDFLAVVDYAHTEDALEGLLMTARQLLEAYRFAAGTEKMFRAKRRQFDMADESKGGKIITVFGCGGNRDRGKRSKMGRIAAQLSDFVIITSDNPRNEDPKSIIREIEKGIEGDNYIVIPDRNVAIGMAVELASAGDIVLIAGKGHEEYQEIRGMRRSFSDRTALENAIRRTISRPAFGGGTNLTGAEASRC
jgi:UDP-N-acetylmuramoyl-L-alanyl-D-glutamate--2,6-diaminopimelate ligase